MLRWLRRLRPLPLIPDSAWQSVLASYPFLAARPKGDIQRLRLLSARFLRDKEFQPVLGFEITDEVALAVAAQAVLPVLHLPGDLDWYDDFVGIVIAPAEVSTRRTVTDDAGVVHEYNEEIMGEAMERGPVTLSWTHIQQGGLTAAGPIRNVVIHEFAHKIDMRDGEVDGCPPLPPGFLGQASAASARKLWASTLQSAYEAFREQSILAERFGAPPPWLDDYAASSIGEFFAVACEAYFVDPARFRQEQPSLSPLFQAFFEGPPHTTDRPH